LSIQFFKFSLLFLISNSINIDFCLSQCYYPLISISKGVIIIKDFGKIAESSDRLKEALALREMKQVELAELSGISKQSINCYVSGKYEPKQEALYKMGKALDVAEMWLAGYDIPMERPVAQKENDQLFDLVERIKKEKDFRQLIMRISNLKPQQLEAVKNLLEAFPQE